jgi:hypothetical protein
LGGTISLGTVSVFSKGVLASPIRLRGLGKGATFVTTESKELEVATFKVAF